MRKVLKRLLLRVPFIRSFFASTSLTEMEVAVRGGGDSARSHTQATAAIVYAIYQFQRTHRRPPPPSQPSRYPRMSVVVVVQADATAIYKRLVKYSAAVVVGRLRQ